MVFPYNAIAAKDRQLFHTYDSLPDTNFVAASFDIGGNGIFGYVGGVEYIQFVNPGAGGILNLNLRNIFDSVYGVDNNSGAFDFKPDLGTICYLSGSAMYYNFLINLNYDLVWCINGDQLFVQFYLNGAPAPLLSGTKLSFCIGFFRNESSKNLIAGGSV